MISTRRAAYLLCAAGATALFSSCAKKPEKKAEAFVATYTKEYQRLSYEVSKAEWASNTHIVEGDTMNAFHSRQAKETYAQFTGSTENIDATKKFLEHRARPRHLEPPARLHPLRCGRQPGDRGGAR